MIINYLKLLVLLKVLNIYINATVINQMNKKVYVDNLKPQLFYIKEDTGLVQVSSSESGTVWPVEGGERAVALDYHHPRDLLVWTTSDGAVYSCSLNQPRNATLMFDWKNWRAVAVAVDYLNDRLYFIDATANTLRLVALDAQHSMVLSVGARYFRPTYLELDPSQGYAFLLDNRNGHASILRINMDGSNPLVIYRLSSRIMDQPSQMTLDRVNKKILVSSSMEKKIFAIDYHGKVCHTVLEPQNGVLGMSITSNELFWVNALYYSYGTSFVDGSVYKCNYMDGQGCKNTSISKVHESFPGTRVLTVKSVDAGNQNRNTSDKTVNSTETCEHLRLGERCACKTGWRLINDGKSCARISEFLIYEDNRIVRSLCHQDNRFPWCQAIEPFQTKIRFKRNERTGFAYDSTTRKLYYGAKESIYSVDIDTAESKRLLYQKGVFYGPMALDWITKNLYYTEIESRGNITFYVLKAMSVRKEDPDWVGKSTSLLWEFGKIHSLVIHPNKGYLFVSTFDNKMKRYRLARLNTDARNLSVISEIGEVTLISMDYVEDKLYALNANGSLILSTDTRGLGLIKVANTSSIYNVTGLLVHGQSIYIKNHTNIYQFDKTNGKYIADINLFPYGTNMSTNIRLHSPKIFSADSNRNPCAENNGGCDNFCFALPPSKEEQFGLRKRCKCFDGIKCKVTTKAHS